MSEDPKRVNFEGLKKEGTEIPDFGFDRKDQKIETVKSDIKKIDEAKENVSMPTEKTGEAQSLPVQQTSSEIKDIENILEEDLGEIYFKLTPEKQTEFKVKGEQTAKDISLLMQKTKVKAKKIIELIKDWLKVIPGINKFFLEQEAKIKADKILEFKKDN
jgi:hypothetical protein